MKKHREMASRIVRHLESRTGGQASPLVYMKDHDDHMGKWFACDISKRGRRSHRRVSLQLLIPAITLKRMDGRVATDIFIPRMYIDGNSWQLNYAIEIIGLAFAEER